MSSIFNICSKVVLKYHTRPIISLGPFLNTISCFKEVFFLKFCLFPPFSNYLWWCILHYYFKSLNFLLQFFWCQIFFLKSLLKSLSYCRWAVAGRNEDRLTKALVTAALRLPGFDYSTIPIIICDVKDQSSIKRMVSQSRIVLNCVGPYR